MAEKVEFIESYIKLENGDYQWHDNHGELVRCKDCKYCEYPKSEKELCKKGHIHGNAEKWFCADGEKAVKCDG